MKARKASEIRLSSEEKATLERYVRRRKTGRSMAQRAVQLVWHETLMKTAAVVEQHAPEIADLAELLERRKEIICSCPSCRKILRRVRPTPATITSVSSQGSGLVHLIEASLASFDDIFEYLERLHV